jgi:hypothetical protein
MCALPGNTVDHKRFEMIIVLEIDCRDLVCRFILYPMDSVVERGTLQSARLVA